MQILQRKFEEVYNSPCWVPDWNENAHLKCPPDISHVLLMGSYYERIFQTEFWPEHPFKLYVLSNSIRDVLVNVFGFDNSTISVINRYHFFEKSNIELEFPINYDFNLLYAGRLSPQKNIEFIILLTFYIQLKFNNEVTLYLYGNFDNEYHHTDTHFYVTEYENKIFTLIDSLPWVGSRPIIKHNLKPEEWILELPKKCIGISASTLFSEDFSVSLAQFQQLGIPLFIPYWAGLKDISGKNVKFYDVEQIAPSSLSINQIGNLANKLADNFYCENKFESKVITNNEQHTYIDRKYLLEIKNQSKLIFNEDIELISQRKFHNFLLSSNGNLFIKMIREQLKG